MKYLLILPLLTSCLATSGDLRGVADKIDAGASVPGALRAQADDAEARSAGLLTALGVTGGSAGGALGALLLALAEIRRVNKKRDKARELRGEPVEVPKPTPKAPEATNPA